MSGNATIRTNCTDLRALLGAIERAFSSVEALRDLAGTLEQKGGKIAKVDPVTKRPQSFPVHRRQVQVVIPGSILQGSGAPFHGDLGIYKTPQNTWDLTAYMSNDNSDNSFTEWVEKIKSAYADGEVVKAARAIGLQNARRYTADGGKLPSAQARRKFTGKTVDVIAGEIDLAALGIKL